MRIDGDLVPGSDGKSDLCADDPLEAEFVATVFWADGAHGCADDGSADWDTL